ncbi:hypothetical protein RND81_02G184900 [Saponaria officinalis]|uniref:C2 domain-containing protein n=1 Tax=Saponaria officinalis TaxID=3572 RepID=A0AAW1MNM0_SAPOF
MESMIGLIKIKVIKGTNLVVKDSTSSDPYVVITMASQKVKTRHVKNDCNPRWNDEVTLAVYDLDVPINLTVYDKDTFTDDDKMGEAQIDIDPYLEYVKAGLTDLPNGSVVAKIHPDRKNCLSDASHIVCKDGKLVQDMVLRLNNVATGEVEIQIEWVNVPGSRGLTL